MALSNPLGLLDLNDDCLLEILMFLSVQEAFLLIGVFDRRFDEIIYKRVALLKTLDISLRDPPPYTPSQLQIIGQHLKTLKISAGYSLDSERCINQFLGPLCQNGTLQNVALHYTQFNTGYQQCFLKIGFTLKILDLSFCQLTDDLLRPILTVCIKLTEFVTIGNYEFEGQSLHCIKSKSIKTITIELNDHNDDAVYLYIANNPAVRVKVFDKYRLGFKLYHHRQVKHSSQTHH